MNLIKTYWDVRSRDFKKIPAGSQSSDKYVGAFFMPSRERKQRSWKFKELTAIIACY